MVQTLPSMKFFPAVVLALALPVAPAADPPAGQPFISWNNPPAQPQPLLRHLTYRSAAMNCEVGYNLYLPPGYAEQKDARFPVLYWCHGRGCTESTDQFPVEIVDDGIRRKLLPPFLVVYLSGGSQSFYSDSVDGRWLAETTVIKELIPHIDATQRTIASREGRAIQGMSMGGFGSLKLALKYPDLFSSVVAFAGGYREPGEMKEDAVKNILDGMFGGDAVNYLNNHPATVARRNWEAIASSKLGVRLYVGTADRLYPNNKSMHRVLDDVGIVHDFIEFANIGHDLPALARAVKTDALEFAAGHLGMSESASKDGPWVNPPRDVVAGCEHHLFYSDAMARPVGYNVYLPPDYASSPAARFPVVYYLHGMTDSESTHLPIFGGLDHAIRSGQVPPLIVVAPYGGRFSWFTDAADGSVRSETMLIRELIPHIDGRWRTLADRGHRAIEGFSMGGNGALRLAAKYPDLFSSAVLVSGGFRTLEEMKSQHADQLQRLWGSDQAWQNDGIWSLVKKNATSLREKVALRAVVGTKDGLLTNSRKLRDALSAENIPLEYEELEGLGHDPRAVFARAGVAAWQFHTAHFAR